MAFTYPHHIMMRIRAGELSRPSGEIKFHSSHERGFFNFVQAMSLPFRITFQNQDYSYTVLTRGINQYTTEIKITFCGEEITLLRNEKKEWYAAEATIGDIPGLLNAIARNVALRFRLQH